MTTCKDCFHYEACKQYTPTSWIKRLTCDNFKDKNKMIELPPLDFGQDVWIIYQGKIKHLKVTGLNFKPYGAPNKERIPMEQGHFDIVLWLSGFTWGCTVDDIGKTVFPSREEAEKALEEMK